jgi:hypothetical protein
MRRDMRVLAAEFPGALRELDALPIEELERRLVAVQAALQGAPAETWIDWMHRYHERMRWALAAKRRIGGRRQLGAADVQRLADALAVEHGSAGRADLVSDVLAPARGRISLVVARSLERDFGLAPDTLLPTLFPSAARIGR